MKFSVIIPVYNVEDFLAECIESILRQTYSGFEIILVDDGSTDQSGAICDNYAAKHTGCVKVIHAENQGPGLARATGIQNASGEILLFVDSDDCLRKDALELLAQRFEEDGCDLMIFNASRKPDYSTALFDFPANGGMLFTSHGKKLLYERLVESRNFNSMCQKAVNKKVAEEALNHITGLWIKNGEDLLMSMSVLNLAEKVGILDQNLYYYRDRAGSAVHTVRLSKLEATKIIHDQMACYIDIWGMPELHGKHCARKVRSWMELLSMVMRAEKQLGPSECKKIVRDMAEDPFFRSAYQRMDAGLLPKKEAILAKWLFERKYTWLWMVYAAKKIVS